MLHLKPEPKLKTQFPHSFLLIVNLSFVESSEDALAKKNRPKNDTIPTILLYYRIKLHNFFIFYFAKSIY